MSRHRDVRSMKYHDEVEGFDDIYGHSVEDDYCISPSTEAQFMYKRNDQTLSAFMTTEENIQEEDYESDEKTRHRDDSYSKSYRHKLNETDKVRLTSCMEEIRNVIGETGPDYVLEEIILQHNFNFEKALDALLSEQDKPKGKKNSVKKGLTKDSFIYKQECLNLSNVSSASESSIDLGVGENGDVLVNYWLKKKLSLKAMSSFSPKIAWPPLDNIVELQELFSGDFGKGTKSTTIKPPPGFHKTELGICNWPKFPLDNMKIKIQPPPGFTQCADSTLHKDLEYLTGPNKGPKSLPDICSFQSCMCHELYSPSHFSQWTSSLNCSESISQIPIAAETQAISISCGHCCSFPTETLSPPLYFGAKQDNLQQNNIPSLNTLAQLHLQKLGNRPPNTSQFSLPQIGDNSLQDHGYQNLASQASESSKTMSEQSLSSLIAFAQSQQNQVMENEDLGQDTLISSEGVSLSSLIERCSMSESSVGEDSSCNSLGKMFLSKEQPDTCYLLQSMDIQDSPLKELTNKLGILNLTDYKSCDKNIQLLAKKPSMFGYVLCLKTSKPRRKNTSLFPFGYCYSKSTLTAHNSRAELEIKPFDFSTPSPDDIILEKQKQAFTREKEKPLFQKS